MNAAAKIDTAFEPTVETPREALRRLAADCLEDADDDKAAAEALLAVLRDDRALWDALLSPWEERAARDLIGRITRHRRATLWARPAAPDDRVGALSNMTARLMDFRLPGGKRLAEATGADCAAAAAFYDAQASDMAWKARWLSRVAARAGVAVVGEALDEGALAALRQESEHA